VADAALAMSIIAAPDLRDVYGWVSPAPDYRAGLEDGVRGLRVAFSPTLGGLSRRVHPDVARLAAAAAKAFADLGATVEEADPDLGPDPIDAWNTLWWPSMALQLQPFADRAKDLADPGLLTEAELGMTMPATDHLRAQLRRAELHNAFIAFHERFDLLLTPAMPLPAFEAGHLVPPSGGWGTAWTDWAPFSYPFNLTQQPAASIPCGLTADGLPAGLQIVGPIGADALVLRASRAFEAAHPFAKLDAPRQK
jgi:aspartyl-tRNA(Asn)/glutamyl-tRNA(Gln) amidotransferase subunit A